ncbi:DUF2079 domain-containing protein [Lyngbya sp. PCC 8106]|uniref:DUF2079 domain-containing protein n=1 Tax=Lyngbya sp. (strain PCC 8106) TaxID=313612 RepID=UPI0000EACF44|nr:DUF2079 domain-containing protein [Lyngbya sp. PCC 8106]EAW33620.1 hypothetical protein L8106_29505 [Lyngbya sp. PCC 8106]
MPNFFSKLNFISLMVVLSTILLFFFSSFRHALFQSNAFDLGIFDNGIYLLSQGQKPFVTFRGLHILGDHGALILYPLALLYKIFPQVHWLLLVQAFSLSVGAIPTFYLAINAGLKQSQATTMAVVYLLYPLVFNLNLFDFHPEVIALPTLLFAILAARLEQVFRFTFAIVIILSCKGVLSLTVMALGIGLLLFEKKRICGMIAIFAGLAWFLIATQVIIPHFSGGEPAGVKFYDSLGNSVFEIALNLFLKPGIVLQQIFTLSNLEYLVLLTIPLIWGLSFRHLAPLVGAIPILLLNLLSDSVQQKNLTQQYSLPILPFLLVAVIATLAAGEGWLRQPKKIILWSLVAFLALAKYGYFGSRYLKHFDTVKASHEAVALVETKGSVLTADHIAPHLTHRSVIMLTTKGSEKLDLNSFKYILLNASYPGWDSSRELVYRLVDKLKMMPNFQLRYQKSEVMLFENQDNTTIIKSNKNQ